MDRRTFLQATGSLIGSCFESTFASSVSSQTTSRERKVLFVSVDGLDPEYLHHSDVPNLRRMIRNGVYREGKAVIPSVTNVNNASIVTASFPKDHGITGNYYYDRATAKESYMETADFLLRPTIFELAKKRGMKSALVTSKHKLLTLLARGADVAVSAESPSLEFEEKIGKRENVYSASANYWSFRAARHLLKERSIDLLYLATTDYMMHTYPPGDERSQAHMHNLDKLLGDILSDHSNLEVYLTADHGMSLKTEAIDIGRFLAGRGIDAEAVPIIKDKHVTHHSNLGGACYVYLKEEKHCQQAIDLLQKVQGVEEVYKRHDAATQFNLHFDRIGDLLVLGQKHIVFGSLEKIREGVHVRSHGSRYEQNVPILCYGHAADKDKYQMNLDITRNFIRSV
jgi:phosphonoacetate hydrolase